MTEKKHALEPWQVRTDLDGRPKLDSRDGYTVDRADPTAGKPFVVSTWSLPNARLIAAAPEMLEALRVAKELADVMEGLTASSGDDEWVWAAQEKINAAIAKATGQ